MMTEAEARNSSLIKEQLENEIREVNNKRQSEDENL